MKVFRLTIISKMWTAIEGTYINGVLSSTGVYHAICPIYEYSDDPIREKYIVVETVANKFGVSKSQVIVDPSLADDKL